MCNRHTHTTQTYIYTDTHNTDTTQTYIYIDTQHRHTHTHWHTYIHNRDTDAHRVSYPQIALLHTQSHPCWLDDVLHRTHLRTHTQMAFVEPVGVTRKGCPTL